MIDVKFSSRSSYVFVVPWELDLPGGVNQVVVNLYREILAEGEIQPLIMVDKWSAFRPIEKEVSSRRTVYLRLWPPLLENRSAFWLVKWIIASVIFIPYLIRLIQNYRVSVFNFHYVSLSVFPIALLRYFRLYRGKLILSFHGSDLSGAKKAVGIRHVLWKFILSQADSIVACSQNFAVDVCKFAGKAKCRVCTIYNGIDFNYFLNNADQSVELPVDLCDRRFILTVAAFEHRKGLDVLLKAFREVRRKEPNIALVLVGWGKAKSDLQALINKLELVDVFMFESVPHNQIALFLERATVFCLPSRSEPFGIVILEAGVFRLPVVASCIGGVPEIIVDGETGLLVEPENVEALSFALQRVLSDLDFANHLGEHLHRHVILNFSWRRTYEQYRALVFPTRIV